MYLAMCSWFVRPATEVIVTSHHVHSKICRREREHNIACVLEIHSIIHGFFVLLNNRLQAIMTKIIINNILLHEGVVAVKFEEY